MGGIKVAASGPAAHGFLAYLSIANNRSLGDASYVSFSVFVFMDCSGVIKLSSYPLGLFCERGWDVSRRPRQKYKKIPKIFSILHVTVLPSILGTSPFDHLRFSRLNALPQLEKS